MTDRRRASDVQISRPPSPPTIHLSVCLVFRIPARRRRYMIRPFADRQTGGVGGRKLNTINESASAAMTTAAAAAAVVAAAAAAGGRMSVSQPWRARSREYNKHCRRQRRCDDAVQWRHAGGKASLRGGGVRAGDGARVSNVRRLAAHGSKCRRVLYI
jgi:hypothetical protein